MASSHLKLNPSSLSTSDLTTQTTNQITTITHTYLPPPEPPLLTYAQYLPLVTLLIPIFGSYIHGSLAEWQDICLCGLLLLYLFNALKLPWLLLRVSQLAPSSLQAPQHSHFKHQLRSIELIAFSALLASPIVAIGLLKLLHSALNPNRPINPLGLRLVFLAAAFKPAGYLLGRLRAGTPFGTRPGPPLAVAAAQAVFSDLAGEYIDLSERAASLETQLVSDPELKSLRAAAEVQVGKLGSQFNQRLSSIDRMLQNQRLQIGALTERIGKVRDVVDPVVNESNRLARDIVREQGWLWGIVVRVVGEMAVIGMGRQKLSSWFSPTMLSHSSATLSGQSSMPVRSSRRV